MKTQSSGFILAGTVLLLALMALLADGAALRESVTFDEVAHIGAGREHLQKLDMRMNEEHPPLAKVLAAVPLVIRGVHADYSHVSWTFSGSGIFKQMLGEMGLRTLADSLAGMTLLRRSSGRASPCCY